MRYYISDYPPLPAREKVNRVDWRKHLDLLRASVESKDNAAIAEEITKIEGFKVSKYSVANALKWYGIKRSPEALKQFLNGNRNRRFWGDQSWGDSW